MQQREAERRRRVRYGATPKGRLMNSRRQRRHRRRRWLAAQTRDANTVTHASCAPAADLLQCPAAGATGSEGAVGGPAPGASSDESDSGPPTTGLDDSDRHGADTADNHDTGSRVALVVAGERAAERLGTQSPQEDCIGARSQLEPEDLRCVFCGCVGPEFVRNDFLHGRPDPFLGSRPLRTSRAPRLPTGPPRRHTASR